ncbi:MAG: hypothetical protein A3C30_02345 [Candidatus Levybacteria bacterium RIFCSPHIGHO2_02_FULL_40_18]|nr:MAG: hypothetical protein A2869_04725 [Candidatus Levybacteria bacterium RIFCSPHIGHO2_01_FULL_40_58]OGH26827.1 MAG: hypothetical protein A3C30_02345 [Candidatus Levybacteria bacterium RIFCSPHIGHO2_02_FULL_40_18]OGH31762.1 MAG: hypothetical protein A3E43_02065 [Candidatus Levybacteria bacterium RIFCSPHIGHO2_12_FULL_40_31]OGH40662.1 MAG: hypothetical protein A2894_00615 [Candidatus Levybacteria bacterium RIFCSPLOWO2_01_FULL_40_64]OGH48842.1 MAG: hypothetical protein A3I54_02560 [Candidatus Lev
MFENINYIELIVAGVAALVLGFVWYSMTLFGKPWLKSVGFSESEMKEDTKKNAPKMFGLMFVGAVVQAYVLSILLGVFGAGDYTSGATVAFWAWLGFIAPVVLGAVLFEKRPWNYWSITAGYQLVNMIVMSAVIVSL